MNGIDISGNQKGINLITVPCDFVIVKATQGTTFINPEFEKQIGQAEQLGKYLGVYHYAGKGGFQNEAEHFLNTVKDYIGKAILVLDWESYQNSNWGDPYYAVKLLDYVKNKTGITPFIYMSKSVCREHKSVWNPEYPLWCAQYANKDVVYGYKDKPWTDSKGFGPWQGCKIFQYTGNGRLVGYNKPLDLDLSYMDGSEWQAWASGDLLAGTPEIDTNNYPILRRGDRNEYVASWQRLLNVNGYDCGKADGIFGQRTQDALVRWQQDHGIEAGYVGPQTWETIQ